SGGLKAHASERGHAAAPAFIDFLYIINDKNRQPCSLVEGSLAPLPKYYWAGLFEQAGRISIYISPQPN
ncbi:MAG TPA: hypothetical protein VF747_15865, partial [Blastocatellia bacterium]